MRRILNPQINSKTRRAIIRLYRDLTRPES